MIRDPFSSVIDHVPNQFPAPGGEPGPWKRFRALCYTLSGSTFSVAAIPQGTEFDLALFLAAAPVELEVTEFYEGNCFVGTTQVMANQSMRNRYTQVVTELDAAEIATATAATRTGGLASLLVNSDIAVEALPVQWETNAHGILSTSGGSSKNAQVEIGVTCRGVPNGPVLTAGVDGELVQPVILAADDYTAEIRDAGNRVVVGDKHYVVVGIYSLRN